MVWRKEGMCTGTREKRHWGGRELGERQLSRNLKRGNKRPCSYVLGVAGGAGLRQPLPSWPLGSFSRPASEFDFPALPYHHVLVKRQPICLPSSGLGWIYGTGAGSASNEKQTWFGEPELDCTRSGSSLWGGIEGKCSSVGVKCMIAGLQDRIYIFGWLPSCRILAAIRNLYVSSFHHFCTFRSSSVYSSRLQLQWC